MKYTQYKFTVLDISKATGQKESKVRRDIRNGILVPSDIVALAAYICGKKLLGEMK